MCNQKVRYEIEVRDNVATLKRIHVFEDRTLDKYKKCRNATFNKEKKLS